MKQSKITIKRHHRSVILIIWKYILWTILLLKRQLSKITVWGMLLGIPVISYVYINNVQSSDESMIRVGLYAMDEDIIVKQTIENLCHNQTKITFYEAETAKQIEEDVRNRNAISGYVFQPEFTQYLLQQNLRQRIDVYALSTNKLSSITNEIVYAQLFRSYGGVVADDYVHSSDIFQENEEQAREQIQQAYQNFTNSEETFHLNIERADKESKTIAAQPTVQIVPIRNILYLLILFAGMMGGAWWKKEQAVGMFRTMSVIQTRSAIFLYSGVQALLCAISTIVTLVVTKTYVDMWKYELLRMAIYIAVVMIFTEISCLISDQVLYITWTLVYLIFCFIIQLIVLETGNVLPYIAILKKLVLPAYFIG